MPPIPPNISGERVLEALAEMDPGIYTLHVVADDGSAHLVMEGGFYFAYNGKVYSFGQQSDNGDVDK